jgi:putative transposase
MLRSYKYRLYPTRSQAVALNGMLGAFCELYNAGLQQRIEAYHGSARAFVTSIRRTN